MPRISSKRQVTLSVESLKVAGLKPGDQVRIESDGPGRIVLHCAESDLGDALGIFDGLYEPDYLDCLRSEGRQVTLRRAAHGLLTSDLQTPPHGPEEVRRPWSEPAAPIYELCGVDVQLLASV